MDTDLTTYYGGLKLHSPVVVGACPLTAQEQTRVAIQSAGAGAMVLPSLFDEQVSLWNRHHGHALTQRDEQLLERSDRLGRDESQQTAESYLEMVNQASARTSIPIIANLNVQCGGNWQDIAKALQQAGAAAIELNVQHAAPDELSGPREAEDRLVELVSQIDKAIEIPLLLKLEREYTSLSHVAQRLLSGIQGLVLYGRRPTVDIYLDTLELKTEWGLTQAGSILESLGSIMRVHGYCPAMPLAASGGISSAGDVIKVLLAGADVAMVTSAIYRDGPAVIRTFIDGLIVFLERHQMRTMQDLYMRRPIEFSSEQQRRDYAKVISSRVQDGQWKRGGQVLHSDRWGHPDASR